MAPRRSTAKLWPEFSKKYVGQFATLAWLIAIIFWLAFTSSGYSLWQSFFTQDTLRLSSGPGKQSYADHHIWSNGSMEKEGEFPSDEYLRQVDPSSETEEQHVFEALKHSENASLQMITAASFPTDSNEDSSIFLAEISERARQAQGFREISSQIKQTELISPQLQDREPLRNCASVEEMGLAAVGDPTLASLEFRRLIKDYFLQHGASHVRSLPAEEFCCRGFVYGRATEDGLGNDIYKILTAAGLSIMLNRSLIIGEHGSTNPSYLGLSGRVHLPFGDYLSYSNQTFTIREVKQLWVKHDCAGTFQRRLTMRIDDFQRPTRTKVFCEDWSKWQHPIIWFKGTTDSNALQFFLKNRHPAMRLPAFLLMGKPSDPSSRPNVFGELFQAFINPAPIVEEAVQWVLRDVPDPDLSIHMRMLNSRSRAAVYAVCNCLKTLVQSVLGNKIMPSIVIVSDTPSTIRHIKQQLEGYAQVLYFDHQLFVRSYQNLSKVMGASYFQPPEKRIRDWGSMPRWVAIVDLFLASRARNAVISGANRRVGTTYAQLVASLAAAIRLDGHGNRASRFGFYSSFQSSLVAEGLAGQRGWGHTWRRFAGRLSCKNQRNQCAKTPLLPYAWWDGPWQSPVPRDLQRMMAYGIKVAETGAVEEESLEKFCQQRKTPVETLNLELPSCKKLNLCKEKVL